MHWAISADGCNTVATMGFECSAAGMTTSGRHDAAAADLPGIMQIPMAERRGRLFAALFARATTSHLSANEKAGIALFVVIVVTLYFLPTMIAAIHRVPGIGSIVAFNTFLGWTMFWRVFSLASALQHVERSRRLAPPPSVSAVPVATGWYRDPINASRLRYHDGHNWTDTAAAPPNNASRD